MAWGWERQQVSLIQFLNFRAGSGKRIWFGEDRWIGPHTLAHLYPDIFILSTKKGATIAVFGIWNINLGICALKEEVRLTGSNSQWVIQNFVSCETLGLIFIFLGLLNRYGRTPLKKFFCGIICSLSWILLLFSPWISSTF